MPDRRTDKMALVAFMQAGSTSVYAGSWRHPATEHRYLDASYYAQIGRQLEEGCFDLMFFDDRLAMPGVYGGSVAEAVSYGARPVKLDLGVVLGEVDDAVVGRVVGPVPGELEPFAADLQGPAIAERLVRRRPVRVVVAEQEPPGLLVPDPDDVLSEERGRAAMVRVMVGVDQVGHPVADAVGVRDLVDRPLEVVPDAGRRIASRRRCGGPRSVGPHADRRHGAGRGREDRQ